MSLFPQWIAAFKPAFKPWKGFLKFRRRSNGSTAPDFKLRIGKKTYRPSHWSPSGFRLRGAGLPLKRSDRVEGRIALPNGPKGTFVAEVLWVGKDGETGFRFLEIAADVFLELSALQSTPYNPPRTG